MDRLRDLHNTGFLHCDLKPDNILIGSSNLNNDESGKIYLIDFGVTKSWRQPQGNHIELKTQVPFSGNILFSSVNCFKQIS